MLRPRAHPAVVPALLLALLLGVTGCGDDEADQPDGPGKAATACREEWSALESEIAGRDTRTNPSALAQRWNSIGATVEYYASSATARDCGETIEGQEEAMAALAAFTLKLAPYDMELRLTAAQAAAEAKPAARPALMAAALKTLAQQAPLATRQQGPGWQQARVVELTDATAVAKAVKDLAFLSSESAAYRASTAALAQIRAAARPVVKKR